MEGVEEEGEEERRGRLNVVGEREREGSKRREEMDGVGGERETEKVQAISVRKAQVSLSFYFRRDVYVFFIFTSVATGGASQDRLKLSEETAHKMSEGSKREGAQKKNQPSALLKREGRFSLGRD